MRFLTQLIQNFLRLGIETLVVGPRNTAIIVGIKMEMKCEVDSDFIIREWSIQRTLTSKTETLFSNWKKNKIFITHFGVNINDFGSGMLYVNSTTLDDAGIYIMHNAEGSNAAAEVQRPFDCLWKVFHQTDV